MRIIEAGFEYLAPHLSIGNREAALAADIARAGRTCYKSEGRAGDDIAFVRRIISRGHYGVLEHGNIIMRCSWFTSAHIAQLQARAEHQFCRRFYLRFSNLAVSGNVRAWREFLQAVIRLDPQDAARFRGLMQKYPVFFGDLLDELSEVPSWEFTGEWREITQDELCRDEILIHRCESARFIVDRGISHEMVRHREESYCQESTRYCNYSADRFGSEITVIRPYMYKPGTQSFDIWRKACENAEKAYFELLNAGEMPETARDVLPTSTKTEVVMTATLAQWQHFFELRALGTTGRPHPQMLQVAIPLLNKFADMLPDCFHEMAVKAQASRYR